MTNVEERAGLLAECLVEINEALIEMTAVFRVKRDALAHADMKALDELLAREQEVAEALFDAETRREVLAAEIASAAGVPSERLADLVEALPQGAAEALSEAGANLRDTMGHLVREARIVSEICRAATQHYDRLIRIITGATLSPVTYGAGGKGGALRHRNIIDKAI
jgi:hypothetical protein